MARPATGSVVVDERRRTPTYGLRFRAYGERRYVSLGTRDDGWTRQRAQEELENVLAQVRLGIWQPVEPVTVAAPSESPTFHEFASEWLAHREAEELRPATLEHLRWALTDHLLPYFAKLSLDAITVKRVDAYVAAKARERKRLSASSINRTVSVLGSILEVAVEYELIGRNPAKGRRRRLPTVRPARSFLDSAEHVAALLDAAGALDAAARVRVGQRRALVAVLVFGGLRISEALGLRWRDVDLARGVLHVRESKTDAGVRTVPMLPALRDELSAYAAAAKSDSGALVFGTSTGAPQGATNVRKRVLAKAIETANETLAKAAIEPIPVKLTPHSLRRTAASIWFAVGETPPAVMAALGHRTSAVTLNIYAREMQRRDGEPERLRALVEGRDWTAIGQRLGSSDASTGAEGAVEAPSGHEKSPR